MDPPVLLENEESHENEESPENEVSIVRPNKMETSLLFIEDVFEYIVGHGCEPYEEGMIGHDISKAIYRNTLCNRIALTCVFFKTMLTSTDLARLRTVIIHDMVTNTETDPKQYVDFEEIPKWCMCMNMNSCANFDFGPHLKLILRSCHNLSALSASGTVFTNKSFNQTERKKYWEKIFEEKEHFLSLKEINLSRCDNMEFQLIKQLGQHCPQLCVPNVYLTSFLDFIIDWPIERIIAHDMKIDEIEISKKVIIGLHKIFSRVPY